jgi:hypothetical protein
VTHKSPNQSFFLTLSPTFTEAANGTEEAMATRSARGRRNLIMINVFVVVLIFDVVVCVATHQLVSGGKGVECDGGK